MVLLERFELSASPLPKELGLSLTKRVRGSRHLATMRDKYAIIP
jgi:hypothetical protein